MHTLLSRRRRGVIAILFALMLLGALGMIGLAVDLGQVYNRKAELQTLADATALAAARQLDGTAAGVTGAVNAAASAASSLHYRYDQQQVVWSGAALRFAAAADTPDAGWVDAAGAQAAPAGMLFAKVDTSALGADLGAVSTLFIRAIAGSLASVNTAARAVAGRAAIAVTPLAICALSATAAASRANVGGNASYNELVEYGFRRGVGYDLMKLNPNGVTAEHFLIDPLAPPGTPGTAGDLATGVVGPFVCAGSMPLLRLTGGTITVQRGFPLATLYQQLNARFDNYSGNVCTPEGAPPDSNIKAYSTAGWMTPAPAVQTAASWTSGGAKLWTRADPLPGDATNTAAQYGVLWSFARAVPYSAYTASPTEPANGYGVFAASAWSSLYTPGPPTASGYPATLPTSTPYLQTAGANFQAPSAAHQPGLAQRRVLNVALLSCPVAAGSIVSATVLGIGRFFMTVPATTTSLSAEFAGATPAAALTSAVELQQ